MSGVVLSEGFLNVTNPEDFGRTRFVIESCNWLACSKYAESARFLIEFEVVLPAVQSILPPTPPDFATVPVESLTLKLSNSTDGITVYTFGRIISFNEDVPAD